MLRKRANVVYDPEAECPEFDKFMKQITCQDEQLEDYILRIYGMGLSGKCEEHKVFIFIGEGANGKSTLVYVVHQIMGGYAQTAPVSLFTAGRKSDIRPDIVRLGDIRFLTAQESDIGDKLDEGTIKMLSGGDSTAARDPYKTHVEIEPVATFVLCTNNFPIIRGKDNGIWRRVTPIPFNLNLTPPQMNPELPEILLGESSGILNRFLNGRKEWQSRPLHIDVPSMVTELIENYPGRKSPFERYLEARCLVHPGASSTTKILYDDYEQWAEDEGEYVETQYKFSRWINTHPNVRKSKDASDNRIFIGITPTSLMPKDRYICQN